jgi:hypothetical protein
VVLEGIQTSAIQHRALRCRRMFEGHANEIWPR